MKAGIIIQARLGSTRLPGKVLLPFFSGQSILEILINRLMQNRQKIPVFVATTTLEQDNEIEALCAKLEVDCFRGDETDVRSRFITIGEEQGFEQIIRVCADNPFLDLPALESLIKAHQKEPKTDYFAYSITEGKPSIQSHIGLFAESVRLDALSRAEKYSQEAFYREHVTNYLYTHPTLFKVKLIPAPDVVYGRGDIRLTLDTPEDFELQQQIYRQLNKGGRELSISSLIEYIDRRKILLEQMKVQIAQQQK